MTPEMITWLMVVLLSVTTLTGVFTTWLWRKRARNFQRQSEQHRRQALLGKWRYKV